jgi:hypothetical protein
VFAAPTLLGATTLEEYADQLDRATFRLSVLFDKDRDKPTDSEIAEALDAARRLLPANLEVVFEDNVLKVDNTVLIKSLERVSTRYRKGEGSAEDRYDDLLDVASQVNLLSDRVDAALHQATAARAPDTKLQSILARPEYQADVRQETRFYRWVRQLWQLFLRLLNHLAPSPENTAPTPGRASLDAIRALIVVGLLLRLGAGSYFLLKRLRRFRRRRKGDEDEVSVREILGEEITAETTAEDLMARAAELARQGDYRAAIRRAFVALLFELEQRGKVRLDPSKTNHDYLKEVRHDSTLIEPVTSMTSLFERVWYGERGASSDEYFDFMKGWELIANS